MITVTIRNEITRKAFEAVRALTGEQFKLNMVSYHNANDRDGDFRFETIGYDLEVGGRACNLFDIKLQDGEIISVVPVERRIDGNFSNMAKN